MKKTDFDMNDFKQKAAQYARNRDFSGAVFAVYEGKNIAREYYGFSDREAKTPTDETSEFLISIRAPFITALCLLKLSEEGIVRLSDTLDEYIPEYEQAQKLTLAKLIKGASLLPDCFYGGARLTLHATKEYAECDALEKLKADKLLEAEGMILKDALCEIKDKPLTFEPGVQSESYSATNGVFLQAVIERAGGVSLAEFIDENIFAPLRIEASFGKEPNSCSYIQHDEYPLLRLKPNNIPRDCFALRAPEAYKLLCALTDGRILRKSSYKRFIKCDKNGDALGIKNINGALCARNLFLGYECDFFFEPEIKLGYMLLGNEGQRAHVDGSGLFECFFTDVRDYMQERFTYPSADITYEQLSAKTLYDASALMLSAEQRYFVDTPLASFAFALAHKSTMKAFVLCSNSRAVGINVLSADKKSGKYKIEIALVGKQYQHRGFGRMLLTRAIAYLEEEGAREIEIGVDRMNTAAQNLYFSLGFETHCVYDAWLLLKRTSKPA